MPKDKDRRKDVQNIRIPGRGQVVRNKVPDSMKGVNFEIDRAIAMVQQSVGDPLVVRTSRMLVSQCPDKDKYCEMGTVYSWLNDNYRYVLDSQTKEVMQTPNLMLRDVITPPAAIAAVLGPGLTGVVLGTVDIEDVPPELRRIHHVGIKAKASGDCEEISSGLLASMLGAIGHDVAFELGGYKRGGRIELSHIWVADRIGDEWIHLDLSEKTDKGKPMPIGWKYDGFTVYRHVPIFDE